MSTKIKIDFRKKEQEAYEGLKLYLKSSKHSTLQKRTYTKPGEFHFYDLCSLDFENDDKIVISSFKSGPDTSDLYFDLHETTEVNGLLYKGSIDPDYIVDSIRERVLYLGETALERIESLNVSHPVNTPVGYSVWATKGSRKTLENLQNAINEGIFTESFKDYCEPRNFCVKFRKKS